MPASTSPSSPCAHHMNTLSLYQAVVSDQKNGTLEPQYSDAWYSRGYVMNGHIWILQQRGSNSLQSGVLDAAAVLLVCCPAPPSPGHLDSWQFAVQLRISARLGLQASCTSLRVAARTGSRFSNSLPVCHALVLMPMDFLLELCHSFLRAMGVNFKVNCLVAQESLPCEQQCKGPGSPEA